jgi:hypothetical protein
LGKIVNETDITYLKYYSRNLPRGAEENSKNSKSGDRVYRTRIKLITPSNPNQERYSCHNPFAVTLSLLGMDRWEMDMNCIIYISYTYIRLMYYCRHGIAAAEHSLMGVSADNLSRVYARFICSQNLCLTCSRLGDACSCYRSAKVETLVFQELL